MGCTGHTMLSEASSPFSMVSRMPSCRSNKEDMVTARVRPRLSSMKGVFVPFPEPGAPLSQTISFGDWNL